MADEFKLCLVGAGNMGGAMLKGWLKDGFPAGDITVIDPGLGHDMAKFLEEAGVRHVDRSPEEFKPDILLVAVKPQMMGKVLPGLKCLIGENTVCVSVAAGTRLSEMQKHLGDGALVRAMPNTPSVIMRGMTVCYANERVNKKQCERIDGLLKAIGKCAWVENEEQIDAVTAVSGSGPAYVFHLAECMAMAGMKEGLSEPLANLLARETIAGAGQMLSQLSEGAGQLRENVTSPNGTTAAALSVLMKDDAMGQLFEEAIHAARKRSIELSG